MNRAMKHIANLVSQKDERSQRLLFSFTAALAAALWLFTRPTVGDDAPRAGQANKPFDSAGESKSNSLNNQQSGHEDAVRHHAALGVLLGKTDDGVSVVGVLPGSAAERADLRVGDEIRYLGDQRIRTTQELIDEIRRLEAGTPVELLIRRNGRRLVVEASLGARESTFGRQARYRNDDSDRNGAPTIARPYNRAQSPNDASNSEHYRQPRAPDPQTLRRIRELERQIARMQQELNSLRYSQTAVPQSAANPDDWSARERRGEEDDDPALFQ